jgi:hypothetical protein
MNDTQRDELREALKAAVYCIDNHYEEGLGPCDCDQANKARAALSRLSAQAEPAKDAGGLWEALEGARIDLNNIAVGGMTPAWYERKAREGLSRLEAALSRLAAQAEPTKDARELANRLSNLYAAAKRCPNCSDIGWYVTGSMYSEDGPEQEQCEFCYTVEDSLFNVKQRAAAEIERSFQARLSASGQGEERGHYVDSDQCAECGAGNGLHHYQTNQCPKGGVEAPIGKRQEWADTTFHPLKVWVPEKE